MIEGGVARPLPRSRKTRGLIAYLALENRPHRRDDLCRLFWELPNDPRAALRWSLSKLRPLFGPQHAKVLVSGGDTVMLDRSRVDIDVVEIRDAMAGRASALSDATLRDFEGQLSGGFPAGLEDAGSVDFVLWCNAEREALRELHASVIGALLDRDAASAAERLQLSAKRVALDRFDEAANLQHLQLILEQRGLSAARRVFDEIHALHREERRSDEGLVSGWMRLANTSSSPAASRPTPIEVATDEPLPEAEAQALPARPSLAVLDFEDLGSHEAGAVLANGLVVDLTSRLAQLSNFFVIAHASAARISREGLSPREAARRLGVRYLISGTTQRQDRRVRVTVTLLDAGEESEIWSEHFDRPLDDLFEVQDEITNALVATIEPAIERAEMQRALIKPPESLTAWELYHRGLWHCFRFTAADSETARHWFDQALDKDPNFSRAHAGRSFVHYSRAFLNAVPDVAEEVRRSLDAANQSIGLDARDAMGHWAQGRTLFLLRQHDAALTSIEQALSINPNYAQGHYAKGFIGIHSGIEAPAIGALDLAQRLSPYDPLLFAMKSSRSVSLALQGRYDEAAPWAIRATHEPNAHFHIYAIAAAILELAGRSSDARDNARWVLEREPDYSVEVFRRSFPHKDEALRAPMLDALVRAGIPRNAR